VDRVSGDIFLTVKPDTDYGYPLMPPAAVCCLSRNQTAVGSGRRPLCNIIVSIC